MAFLVFSRLSRVSNGWNRRIHKKKGATKADECAQTDIVMKDPFHGHGITPSRLNATWLALHHSTVGTDRRMQGSPPFRNGPGKDKATRRLFFVLKTHANQKHPKTQRRKHT